LAINSLPDLQGSSKSIFVTGATGFIGQRLASSLLEQNFQVRALVRPGRMPDSRIPPGCEQIPVDLTDVQRLSEVVAESSAVVYAAGTVRGRSIDDFATANIHGVQALLDALGQIPKAPPTLLLSSLAASRPQLSDYANSKFQGEQLFVGDSDLPWTILRPPAVYGPGDKEMLPLLKMIRRGLLAHAGPHDQRLSLLHVDDLVSAMISWISAPENCFHQTYSIDDGTAGGYDWNAIGEAVSDRTFRVLSLPDFLLKGAAGINLLFSKLLGYSPMLSPGKARELVQADWLCDNRRFCEATGWKPRLDLKQGARQLFETL
jgi:nucleoside-diphosphate-sugar epimerase